MKQINFMKEKFEGGKKSGRKCDPFFAAEEIINMKCAEQFVFLKNVYLTGQQIASYLSRLAVKDRKTDLNDFLAAEQEVNKDHCVLKIIWPHVK